MQPYSWRVPETLSGTFKLVPQMNGFPFEAKVVTNEIRIEGGKLAK